MCVLRLDHVRAKNVLGRQGPKWAVGSKDAELRAGRGEGEEEAGLVLESGVAAPDQK